MRRLIESGALRGDRYLQVGLRGYWPPVDVFAWMKQHELRWHLMREIEERYGEGAEVSHLDGVSIDYEDWHFNVRPSNTEPLLRLNLESLISREDMERRRDEILALIRS